MKNMTHKNSDARKTHSRSLMLVAVAAVAALTGCASLMQGGSPEKIVEKRSADYWQARSTGKTAKAYQFMTPGYRAINDERSYALSYGAIPNLRDPELISVSCDVAEGGDPKDAQRCTVRKKYTSKVALPMVKKMTVPIALDEIWVKQEGQWWLYLR